MDTTSSFFCAKKVGNTWLTEGQKSCFLGHKIENTAIEKKPNGIFVEWHWDGQKLVVNNDYCGFYPVYYFARPEQIALSTSIEKLLALGASPILDEAALSAFFHLGYFLGEDTPFAEIKALPPIKSFVWGERGLELSDHRPWNRQAVSIRRDEVIEPFTSLLRQSILRRLPRSGNFAVPLSGGKDSRHILLELCAVGSIPKCCITIAEQTSPEEVAVARQVADALRIPLVVLPQNSSKLNDELRKNRLSNFCASEHSWYMAMVDYVPGRFDTLYDGIGGDVFTMTTSPERVLYYKNQHQKIVEGNFREVAEEMIPKSESYKLFSRRWHNPLKRQMAIARLTTAISEIAQAASPMAAFHFANRTRRQIALSPYAMLRGVDVYSPFLDVDLFDFLASLPIEIFIDPSVHLGTLHKSHPAYAHIPLSRRGCKKSISWRHSRHFAAELIPYALRQESSAVENLSSVLPRLVRCLADPWYASSALWIGQLIVYITQLEALGSQ